MVTVFEIKDAHDAERGGFISQIARIETELFYDAWDGMAVYSLLTQYGVGLIVAEMDDELVGYCIYQVVFELAEILRIATDSDFQKKGVGKSLLDEFAKLCQQKEAKRVLLEVRADNFSAIRLYEKHGFYQIDVRKAYYKDETGVVDALILQKDLSWFDGCVKPH